MKILTAAQMSEVDRLTSEIYSIPSMLLMENAGRSVTDELARAVPGIENKRILIFCGKGNNGGDGLVIARYLALRGGKPVILLFCDPASLKGDPRKNWEIVRAMGIETLDAGAPGRARTLLKKMTAPDVIVDALFGTGLSKPIGSEFRFPVQWINGCTEKTFVVSVDIPSGLFADSASVPGPAVKAHLTVTFTALKLALVMPPAAERAGKVIISEIGSPASLIDKPEHNAELIDPAFLRGALPLRARDSHKGTFGHLHVVAGSRGKSGAALMTGLAALRSGAGLVTLWLPAGLHRDVVGKVPELMSEFLPETSIGSSDVTGVEEVLRGLSEADALVVGPGLTQEAGTRSLIRELVARSSVPVVLDADGINAFASHPESLRNGKNQPLIITPHPGEMARLAGSTIRTVQKNRIETAGKFARIHGCQTILKGYQTIIATPGGGILINGTGNPGMATGGTGDILAGMVGRFVGTWNRGARGRSGGDLAAHLAAAVYLHGLAGDLAAVEKGEESLIATDLLACLPAAFKQVRKDLYDRA
jgi:hydroxyethylthiazole kinase-like uncharacterized protein yjeF